MVPVIPRHPRDINADRLFDALAQRAQQRVAALKQGRRRLCSMPQGLIDMLAQIGVHRVEMGVQGCVELRHGGEARRRLKIEDLDVPLIVRQALGARI